MVLVFDMVAGRWSDEEGDDEGPGRGGCRRPPSPMADARRRMPSPGLSLMPVGPIDLSRAPGR